MPGGRTGSQYCVRLFRSNIFDISEELCSEQCRVDELEVSIVSDCFIQIYLIFQRRCALSSAGWTNWHSAGVMTRSYAKKVRFGGGDKGPRRVLGGGD